MAAALVEANGCPGLSVNRARLAALLKMDGQAGLTARDRYVELGRQFADDYRVDPAQTCKVIWDTLGDQGQVPGVIGRN